MLFRSMWGAAPDLDPRHPWAGFTRFKLGFGGRLVHRHGSWDYPLDNELYETWRHEEYLREAQAVSLVT